MAKPLLSKPSVALGVSGISLVNNWQDSAGGLTTLQVLQGASATDYVYGTRGVGGTDVTGPLVVTMDTFTPTAAQYLYGVLLEITAVGATGFGPSSLEPMRTMPYLDFFVGISVSGGAKSLTLTAKNLVDPASGIFFNAVPAATTVGETKSQFIYAFDQKITKWDLSFWTVSITLPPLPSDSSVTGISVLFRTIKAWPLYFTPTEYQPVPAFPPHIKDAGVPLQASFGGLAHPYIYIPSFLQDNLVNKIDTPDIVRAVYTDAPFHPQGAVNTNYGLIVPRADDQGLVLGPVDVIQTDTQTRPTGYVHLSSGWLIPASGDYAWGNWKTFPLRAIATRPVAPVLTAAINVDQVDVTCYSCDNLLPPLYSGWVNSIDPTHLDPTQPVAAASTTLSQLSAYDTVNQRSDQIWRATRASTVGVISVTSSPFPVITGKQYVGSAFFRTSIATSLTWSITWYDSSMGTLSTNNIDVDNQTTRTQLSGVVTAPASAAYATVNFLTGSVAVATTLDLDSIHVGRYNGTSIPNFAAGGYIWGNAAPRAGCAKPINGGAIAPWVESDNPATGVVTEIGTAPRTGSFHISYASLDASTLILPNKGHYFPEALPAGTVVSARLWARSVTNQGQLTLGIRFLDTDGKTIQDSWSSVTALTSTATYAVFKCEGVVVPQDAVQMYLLVGLPSTTPTTYYIDDIGIFFTTTCPGDNTATPGISGLRPTGGYLGYLVIERLLGGSVSPVWTPIAIKQIDPTVDTTFSDFVAPEGMTYSYRARVLGLMDGALVEGQYSPVVNLNTASPGAQWTLWDPSDDTKGPLRFDINADDGTLDYALQSALALYAPVGRNRRVLTKDVSKGRIFKFKVDIVSAADLVLWETYHRDRNVLIMTRTSTGECWPIVLTSDLTIHVRNTTPLSYTIDLMMEEVDVPSVW